MTLTEARRLRVGDRVRLKADGGWGTVEFCNWTHVQICWDERPGTGRVRHEQWANKLTPQKETP